MKQNLTLSLWPELCQQVPHLEGLGQVVVLIHVDGLEGLAVRKDDGVVLVLGLTLANDHTATRIPARDGSIHNEAENWKHGKSLGSTCEIIK